ncbi:MAG: tetratricopeptide repeat protein [Kiloniellales bacterium]|nr:tetratricopeptide repeat protein [Kiloniellales bacterium]
MKAQNDCRGVPTSYGDAEAVAALDACLEDGLAFRGDPVASIAEVLERHPDFIMGHCFKAAMLTQSMETRIYGDMVASVEAAERLSAKANDRERGHIAAVRAWIEGDFFSAVQGWEAVLTVHPFDLLALSLIHLTDVLLGDVVGQRDSVARVFPLWDEAVPGYEFLLGFYAFGLEETRDFAQAEEYGRRALAMRPGHPYAVHAVAHVLEMQGRQSGGIWFMNSRLDDWAQSNFRNHLWWHLSLFHLDLGQVDRVLEIYDQELRGMGHSGDKYEELDSAALLWRLKLLDVDTGERWRDLADKWEPSAEDTLYAFNDVHAMMCFVADDRRDAEERLLNANERYIGHSSDANVAMCREIGVPFCRALQDFARGRYGDCVDRLLPVRYRTHRLGGSFAQRDIIGWTLVEAALRARRYDLAVALANERCSLKPSSPQNWKLAARALKGLGDKDRAERAAARAASMLAA